MNESASNSCPQCGAVLPSASTAGLCPRCLMAEAMAPTQPGAESSSGRQTLSPEELAPHFPQLEILECLGRGGMGVVYKARQKTLNRLVALKLLAPERVHDATFAERFTHEAQALAALNHPNIVTIYDFGQAGGFYFLLMEFVDGANLRELLRARKFTPDEALAVIPPLCDALQFAHDQGIVHRDIKPENLLLDKSGRVKVADFGIAKMLGAPNGGGDPARPSAPANVTQTSVGTPAYSAPEQKTDPKLVDSRADIYSLGVVFYEMLTGELPGKCIEPPSRKVHLDVRLDEIVLRALENKPELRYQKVSEVKTCVETITNSSSERVEPSPSNPASASPLAQPAAASVATKKRLPRNLVFASLLLMFMAVALILFALNGFYRPWQKEKPLIVPPHVSAMAAYKGDLPIYIRALGTVDSSNSVSFSVAQNYVQDLFTRFNSGRIVPVQAFDRAQEPFGHGKLVGLDNQIDVNTGTIKCKATIVPDDNRIMVPGLFLNVSLLLDTKYGVTLLPAQDIRHDPQGAFVWLIGTNATVNRGVVKAGDTGDSTLITEIVSGVSPGELVVNGSLTNELHDGEEVAYTVIPPPALPAASAETWTPVLAAGEKPDLQKIRDEIKTLMDQGQYEQALQRQLWYFNHALQYGESNPVRLSFGIANWDELGRRYPKAKAAMLEIRDRDIRKFSDNEGYFDLFLEVANFNREMNDEDSTYSLFQQVHKNDPTLSQRCFPVAEDVLVHKRDYALCLSCLGDPQNAYRGILQMYQMLVSQQKQTELVRRQHGTISPDGLDFSKRLLELAEGRFINQTRQLIEVLIGTGQNAEAEKIDAQALTVLDDPRLRSAVIDARHATQQK